MLVEQRQLVIPGRFGHTTELMKAPAERLVGLGPPSGPAYLVQQLIRRATSWPVRRVLFARGRTARKTLGWEPTHPSLLEDLENIQA
jgi:hypothetical protein